jgi:hypothetical protein
VDKVAASGGYMMACVADKIVPRRSHYWLDRRGRAIPNFNRFLKIKIDIELHRGSVQTHPDAAG